MLFYVDKKGKTVIVPEAVQLVPLFGELSEQDMLYVILRTDYFSIFHQYPENERQKKAQGWVYGMNSINPERNPKVVKAIAEYERIQYDEKRHLLNVIINKMKQYELLYQNEQNPETSDRYLKSLINTQLIVDKYKSEIALNIQAETTIKGNKRKSLVEIMQSNQALYDLRMKAQDHIKKVTITNDLPESKENIS